MEGTERKLGNTLERYKLTCRILNGYLFGSCNIIADIRFVTKTELTAVIKSPSEYASCVRKSRAVILTRVYLNDILVAFKLSIEEGYALRCMLHRVYLLRTGRHLNRVGCAETELTIGVVTERPYAAVLLEHNRMKLTGGCHRRDYCIVLVFYICYKVYKSFCAEECSLTILDLSVNDNLSKTCQILTLNKYLLLSCCS